MSLPEHSHTPSPEPPKSLYHFHPSKWDSHQHMAENGGSEASVHVVDEDLYGDPNLDLEAEYVEDESPYPEVRSAVANTDDPAMPAGTLRAWILGLIWAIVIPGVNQFYFFRYPSVTIGPLVAQLLSFPVGRLMARLLPRVQIFSASLNPGPFSIKEHVVVTIMAGVGASSAYAASTDIVAVQRFYYNQTYNFGYQFIIVMSTQLIGFSIGGIAKRFLVAPPSMIWPSNLVYCALFNTLHAQWYIGTSKSGGISRERFFVYAFTGAVVWYFVPGYLFTALSFFSWVCWIKPHDVTINSLFGYQSGLGMSLITLDWSQISFIGSPLATPWWAQANVAIGFVVFFWIITPIIYFTNVWNSQFIPVLSRHTYDNQGHLYNVTLITTNNQFDEEKYKVYSPLFLPAGFAVSYAMSFASVTATIVHVFLYYRKQIMIQARRSLAEQPDIHARLMSHYPQVPEWWYLCIFILMFAFGIIGIELYSTEMPVWAFVLALIIAFVYTLPIGIIQAVTNQQIGLNVITELVIGYLLPGRPLAMMLFKTWGYVSMSQALTFTSDMKLGHYMKIPPRTMFWCQVVATVIAGIVQLGVQTWMFEHIPDMCSRHQKDNFVCASTEVFYTATVIWGVVGPNRLFSAGQVYGFLRWFFLFGISPIIPWFLTRRYPNSWFRYINIPIILSGTGWIPPASAVNYVPWVIVGFFTQFLVRRRHFGWWSKYNYVLSAALDAGTAIGTILVYFCLQYPSNGHIGDGSILSWWGNTVWMHTADFNMTARKSLEETAQGYFGPTIW
ncbi:small oligopeptide transporter [Irpex rosettiformis]|uniref:Small oligopeptide transporter n=1 Tax=Irpex rosettiformis TaxID=378272 RepID=A0ACB8TUJ7_9APHY|nr:small oligopeptide transporter [Irpex rosettiformis]